MRVAIELDEECPGKWAYQWALFLEKSHPLVRPPHVPHVNARDLLDAGTRSDKDGRD